MKAARTTALRRVALAAGIAAALAFDRAAGAQAAEKSGAGAIEVSEDSAKWESGYGARFYQVVGSLKNQGATAVGAVKLRVELQDDAGKTVAQGTCWNAAAESLAESSDDDAKAAIAAGKVKPIAAGASDKWRCTFLDEDVPKFSRHATAVAAVIPAP